MIFATVGTQLPFERFVRMVDEAAGVLGLHIVCQTGATNIATQHLDVRANLTRDQFEEHVRDAKVVVSHAGMGTILAAKRARKPLILVAREHALGEHRNDHQKATVAQLSQQRGVYVATDGAALIKLLATHGLEGMDPIGGPKLDSLADNLTAYLTGRRA